MAASQAHSGAGRSRTMMDVLGAEGGEEARVKAGAPLEERIGDPPCNPAQDPRPSQCFQLKDANVQARREGRETGMMRGCWP